MSPHWKSFSEVSSHIEAMSALEVVNVPRWVEEDAGRSKLRGTRYVLLEEFLRETFVVDAQVVFLHILRGHGATSADLEAAFRKAKRAASRVLVLEHERRSLELLLRRGIPPTSEVVDLLGEPKRAIRIPGRFTKHRNTLFVYE